jgi:ferredoxin-NADP reductase
MAAKSFLLTFIKKKKIVGDAYIYYFTPNEKLVHIAGQYLQVTLPHNADDRGTNRFFTITSSPTEDYIMITTRKGRSSFKQQLFGLKPQTKVQAFGPMGAFVLVD